MKKYVVGSLHSDGFPSPEVVSFCLKSSSPVLVDILEPEITSTGTGTQPLLWVGYIPRGSGHVGGCQQAQVISALTAFFALFDTSRRQSRGKM